jgi:hypothetical protein
MDVDRFRPVLNFPAQQLHRFFRLTQRSASIRTLWQSSALTIPPPPFMGSLV